MSTPADSTRAGAPTGLLAAPWSRTDRPVPRVVVQPLQRFLHREAAAGVVLLVMAVVALVWANSPAAGSYERLWHTEVGLEVGGWALRHSLHFWVNDALMAVFFFVVGLEIKRELVHGELRDPRAAALPVLAALGGMVVPAMLYVAVNAGGPGANGWGVPMATDIAFAVGVLALVGRRAPASLKVFLLSLAIADDLGAILVIAAFYSSGVAFSWLLAAAGVIAALVVLQRLGVRSLVPYTVLAVVLWYAMLQSGAHATLAGVILGLLTPARPFHRSNPVAEVITGELAVVGARDDDDVADEPRLLEVSRLAGEAVSPLTRLEDRLHLWSAYLILPVFALANAGVHLTGASLAAAVTDPVTLGVVLGLVVGKPLGIVGLCWLAVRTRVASLPSGVTWPALTGVGMLGGVGFTVALFVAGLAYGDPARVDAAKVGILAASTLSAVAGSLTLVLRGRRAGDPPVVATAEPERVAVGV